MALRVRDILAEMHNRGFRAKVQGGILLVRPVSALDDELRMRIKRLETEIIAELKASADRECSHCNGKKKCCSGVRGRSCPLCKS